MLSLKSGGDLMKTTLIKLTPIKRLGQLTMAMLVSSILMACNDDEETSYIDNVSYDLSVSKGEWQLGFADYPLDEEEQWELVGEENSEFTLASGEIKKGYYLHSYNRSDDTQMFITRKISGLMPNAHYLADFNVQLASNVNDQCAGIGGAPHAVTVKASLSVIKPSTSLDYDNTYRLNLDVGQQVKGGIDGQAMGHIGLPNLADCDPISTVYGLKDYDNTEMPFEVTADDNGELWLTLLTDSGFEGPSSLYFTEANVTFTVSDKSPSGFEQDLDLSLAQPKVSALFFDYPIGRELEWQLTETPLTQVKLEQGGEVTGHLLHSYNRSDDTGMLLHIPIKGLAKNTAYDATFKTTIATNVNNICFGIGGAPHAVSVKAGLSIEEPLQIKREGDDHYRLNIDLGNNASEGINGIVLGDIGSDTLADCDPSSELFDLKTFDSQLLEKNFTITTDESGIVYFSIATDSGFEGPTTLLFTQASVAFKRL